MKTTEEEIQNMVFSVSPAEFGRAINSEIFTCDCKPKEAISNSVFKYGHNIG